MATNVRGKTKNPKRTQLAPESALRPERNILTRSPIFRKRNSLGLKYCIESPIDNQCAALVRLAPVRP